MADTVDVIVENIREKAVMITTAAVENVTNNISDSVTNLTEVLTLEDLKESVDAFFIIINSFIIFFLQGGFAFLEAGSVRSKNTTSILIKNLLDILLACAAFWSVGYMFFAEDEGEAGNSFIGTNLKYVFTLDMDPDLYAKWFFSFVFCATSVTIVSGAVAERCELTAYFAYSVLVSGLVYPVVAHWAWAETGWLKDYGFKDFAGSGVVHYLGGLCGLVGAVFLGPRIGRFDEKGKPNAIPGHSVPLAALGAFILLFGFFAFNGSTQGKIATPSDRKIVLRAVMNTLVAGCSSGLTTLIFFRYSLRKSGGKWSLLSTINGTLCGIISTCANCNEADPKVIFLLGIVAAIVYALVHYAMIYLQVDDPLDAVAVHAGGGLLGILATPLVDGGPDIIHQLWVQLVGLLAITAWAGSLSMILFFVLKHTNKLRVTRKMELQGLDIIKHGEPAYPVEAWRENQYGQEGGELGPSLPPNMIAKPVRKELLEKSAFDRHLMDKSVLNETNSEEFKGSWKKVNKELQRQILKLDSEVVLNSEVILTLRPVRNHDTTQLASATFTSMKNTLGIENDAFVDEESITN